MGNFDDRRRTQIDCETSASNLNPVTAPAGKKISPTGIHVDQPETSGHPLDRSFPLDGRTNNAGSDPDNNLRRSGGSPNDPHGGHEHISSELRGPDPDPIDELVPGGQGAEAPPYRLHVAEELRSARAQPGFGPSEFDKPTLGQGNPEIGPDPSDIPSNKPPSDARGMQREGMHETGITKDG
ncbi:MAG: hypothetical protein JWM58_2909 [Rhizobium sp.]|nr:hypothetical protein [Rhizobium sp.]